MERFRYFGDVEKAKTLVHFAKKQMNILRDSMKFQKLWTDVRRWFDERTGIKIVCSVVSGLERIDIYFPPEVPVVEEEEVKYEYKPYLLILIGHYTGIGTDVFYRHNDFDSIYYSLWDVTAEKVVAGPGSRTIIDDFFDGGTFDPDAESATLFKALFFGGNPGVTDINLAYINAEKATLGSTECHLTTPFGQGHVTCSDVGNNVFGGNDTCFMSYENSYSNENPSSGCPNPNIVDFVQESAVDRTDRFSSGVVRYGMLTPLVFTKRFAGTNYLRTTVPGGSAFLKGTGQLSVAIDYDRSYSYNYYKRWHSKCDGSGYDENYKDYRITESDYITKAFTLSTPMGVLFEVEPVSLTVCNYSYLATPTDWYTTGEYEDIGESSSTCKAVYIDSPNFEGDNVVKAALYFCQYNTFKGPIFDDFVCQNYADLITDSTFQSDAPGFVYFGDRKYDVIAGVSKGTVVSDGLSIDKSAGLTQTVKDLVDYYHSHMYYNGEPLKDNYVNTRLDIEMSLFGWRE